MYIHTNRPIHTQNTITVQVKIMKLSNQVKHTNLYQESETGCSKILKVGYYERLHTV